MSKAEVLIKAVTVQGLTITTHDGTVLAEYVLDPTRDYQRKNG